MTVKKLYRSRHNKMISGVCGGIGEYFNVDPTLIRLGWVVFAFASVFFGALIAYFICTLIVPESP